MKVELRENGHLVVDPETGIEAYALRAWLKDGDVHGALEVHDKTGVGSE